MSAEAARLRGDAEIAQRLGEGGDERRGKLRRSGAHEAGAAAFAYVGEQGELTDYERFASDVEKGAVELAGLVAEGTQLGALSRQVLGFGGVVAFLCADEQQ